VEAATKIAPPWALTRPPHLHRVRWIEAGTDQADAAIGQAAPDLGQPAIRLADDVTRTEQCGTMSKEPVK
jgi:hypothetical protein